MVCDFLSVLLCDVDIYSISLEEKMRACEDLQETQQKLDNAQVQLDANEVHTDLIPRPYGTPGDRRRGFILIDELGLRPQPLRYRALRVCPFY
jgi:hypothetical protein